MPFAPPPATVIAETAHWRVNHRVDSRLPGYLIVGALDPAADTLWKVPPAGLAELGPLLARCVRLLEEECRAPFVHVIRYGHSVGHTVHFHLIPVPPWLEEACAADPRYAAPQPDGADLTLYVMRELCESPTPPPVPGPTPAEVVARLRTRFG